MGHLSTEQLRASVEAIRWYQTIDLGGGLVTKGVDNTPVRCARLALPDSFAGQSVLDIGAWDGFFSFEAERRGACRVLATDYFTWKGFTWGSKAGFELARRALESKVEDLEIDVPDISPETVGGEFDVVFFLGVLYHLKEPLHALERIAKVTRRMLIVETVTDLLHVGRPAVAFYPGKELNNDPTNWCAPNLSALDAMLRVAGFRDVRCVYKHPLWKRAAHAAVEQWNGKAGFLPTLSQGRAVFHAFK